MAIYIGTDWSEEKHDVVFLNVPSFAVCHRSRYRAATPGPHWSNAVSQRPLFLSNEKGFLRNLRDQETEPHNA